MDFDFSSETVIWQMGLAEIDANDTSSFRVEVELALLHSTGKFTYSLSDLWLQTDVWDHFETGLQKQVITKGETLSFADMSEYFKLQLVRNEGGTSVDFSVYEPVTESGEGRLNYTYMVDLDSSFISKLCQSFKNWPKHW